MKTDSIVFGGGCFWCLEAAYQMIRGVQEVTPGYSGGELDHPTYNQVCSGTTGHAEVVKVVFDAEVISLEQILNVFWIIHDPTSLNKQGADEGTQYRSIILFSNPAQEKAAIDSLHQAQKLCDKPIVTEVRRLEKFWTAEDYHHNYFLNNPSQAYCQIVINPKLAKLRQRHSGLLALPFNQDLNNVI